MRPGLRKREHFVGHYGYPRVSNEWLIKWPVKLDGSDRFSRSGLMAILPFALLGAIVVSWVVKKT